MAVKADIVAKAAVAAGKVGMVVKAVAAVAVVPVLLGTVGLPKRTRHSGSGPITMAGRGIRAGSRIIRCGRSGGSTRMFRCFHEFHHEFHEVQYLRTTPTLKIVWCRP